MIFSQADELKVLDLGRVGYRDAEQQMFELVDATAEPGAPDHLLVCEFDPLLTVGRAAAVGDYLSSAQSVHSDPADSADSAASAGPANPADRADLPVFEVSRGGKATFHGPGQIVIYPILKLEKGARDLHCYLHALEQALIHAVAESGLTGCRDSRNTGCWIGGRKVASIGVAVRRWVTYHGIALNVTTDLDWFRRFDPCGLSPELMTSMAAELNAEPDLSTVKQHLLHHFREVLTHDHLQQA